MQIELTVATANTHEARMLRNPDGIKPFVERGVDVVLMQEVLRFSEETLTDRLSEDGYQLGHFDSLSGLAIAISAASSFQPLPGSQRTEVIQPPEKIGELIRLAGVPMSSRLRQRGLIAVKLANVAEDDEKDNDKKKKIVTVADTHPIIFLRAAARSQQVRRIGEILQTDYYQQDSLIVGADMNHYPEPQEVDLAMWQAAELSAVEPRQPTWKIRGSKHQWAATAGAFLTRKNLESYDAELDVLLYRGLEAGEGSIVKIISDHHALVAKFILQSC